MKKIALVLLVSVIAMACNQEEIDQLTAENSQLSKDYNEKDSLYAEALEYFNQIHTDLQAIKEKEGKISLTTEENVEFGKSQEEQILDDILTINDLMDSNRKRIEDLEKKLGRLQNKLNKKDKEYALALKQIEELQALIVNYTEMIAEREQQIVELKQRLVDKDMEIDQLNQVSEAKSATIAQQTDELNTAYYVFGSKKELKEKNVITKEGGILGLGGSKKMMDDFNAEYFTRIDITKTKEIPLFAKKAEVITTHPSGSYEIQGEDGSAEKLIITDADKFWSASKYLVVVVD